MTTATARAPSITQFELQPLGGHLNWEFAERNLG